MQIIVNADDLGMSATVNDAIFDLMSAGLISSATILANGPAVRDALARVRAFPQCSFGAHLNLTQFPPLIGGRGAATLTNGTGQLSRKIEAAPPSLALLRAAFAEWCAQIDLLAAAGVDISHLDSHNHVHTRPQIFPVLKAVQRKYRIRRVRLAKNLYAPGQPYPAALQFKKRAYNAALRRIYRTHTTDVFAEFLTFVELSDGRLPSVESAEVMVHPGAAYAGPEIEQLKTNWLGRVGRNGQLINYRQLD